MTPDKLDELVRLAEAAKSIDTVFGLDNLHIWNEFLEAASPDVILGLVARIRELEAAVASLFDSIAHGSEEHKAWLRDAIEKHFRAALVGATSKEEGRKG